MSDEQKMLQRMGAIMLNPGAVVRSADGAWAHGNGCTASPCVGCGAVFIAFTAHRSGLVDITAIRNNGKLRVRLGERG